MKDSAGVRRVKDPALDEHARFVTCLACFSSVSLSVALESLNSAPKRHRHNAARCKPDSNPFVLAEGVDLRAAPSRCGFAQQLRDALVRPNHPRDEVSGENAPTTRSGKGAPRKKRTALVLANKPNEGDILAHTHKQNKRIALPPPPLPDAHDDTAAVARLEEQLAGYSRTALVRSVYRLFKMREAASKK